MVKVTAEQIKKAKDLGEKIDLLTLLFIQECNALISHMGQPIKNGKSKCR